MENGLFHIWMVKRRKRAKMDCVLEQLLIGSMLGDGHIEKPNLNGTPRFREGHSIAQRKYLVWKAKILSNYFKVKIYEGKNNLGKKTVNLYTSCSSELFKLFNLFYPGGIKRKLISVDALRELDDFGLAIWYVNYPASRCEACNYARSQFLTK